MHVRDTTTETLRQVFSQYGELEDAIVTVDRQSGKSKGYGFVTFRYAVNAAAAVVEQEKQIDVSAFKLVLTTFVKRYPDSEASNWIVLHVANRALCRGHRSRLPILMSSRVGSVRVFFVRNTVSKSDDNSNG